MAGRLPRRATGNDLVQPGEALMHDEVLALASEQWPGMWVVVDASLACDAGTSQTAMAHVTVTRRTVDGGDEVATMYVWSATTVGAALLHLLRRIQAGGAWNVVAPGPWAAGMRAKS